VWSHQGVARAVITGGTGFLGARLARELLAAGPLSIAGSDERAVSAVTLIDRSPAPPDLAADDRVTVISGDLVDLLRPGEPGQRALAGADVVFHLAAAVSGECETDFDLGLRANIDVTRGLLEACRELGTNPVLAFSSSVAVFGGSAEHPLPPVVDDHTMPNPQTSYGVQKVIGEQLVADYTRKGFLRGRSIRLMTVSVRPGRPNAAASGFLSGIIREPLAGLRATCPVAPQTEVALASPQRATAALVRTATASDEAWGGRSAVTMPALTVTVGEMVAALERAAGPEVSALVDWIPDPAIAAMFATWPARIRSERAEHLGLRPDPSFDAIIALYRAGTAASH
jgi:D-erythronate 2-dehydrogenase